MSGVGEASATRITPGNALRPEDIAAAVATSEAKASEDVANYSLRLGDDALVLAQHLGHWISRGPELEEDVALGNIALDQLGHARSFLSYAGSAWGKSEDDLAYFRDESEFRSAHLFEQPNGDFAVTIARQFLIANYQFPLYRALAEAPNVGSSGEAMLAAISAKAVKEVDYHLDHSTAWVLRLAGGTEESLRRLITAFTLLWPYVGELFARDQLLDRLLEQGILPPAAAPEKLKEQFDAGISAVFTEAEFDFPRLPMATGGGREGRHSEHLGYLLAQMQVLARAHPGANW